MNVETTQIILRLPDETKHGPERFRCPSPLLCSSNNLNIESTYRKRASSFKKPKVKNLDVYLHDNGMRPRTCSMPSSNSLKKPRAQILRREFMNIEADPDTYTVREFEMNSKGVIIHRSDSLRSRSTNSIVSSEGDIDGEAEKTVNVLLNGEETVLSFLERSDLDDLDGNIGGTVMAYIIVYACDDRPSFDRAVDILYTLRQKQHRDEIIIFVGNKSDLVRSRSVTIEEAKAVAKTYDCKFIETSVVLNVHVDELLVGVVKQLRLRNAAEIADDKVSPGCSSTSKSLLSKIFKKDNISKSCENLYT
ncbi:GTP-binding protein RAD-like [Dreissena polymorpha]|uniref:GTP-binding protein RAD-like n=1 Tax=Dreissena polymorpha TaxID=45954 RepID=UPI002263B2DC|nr:GTP-binding protein RAD-like [Dreissena polymorpha]